MIKTTAVPNSFLVENERDDFSFYDPKYAALESQLANSPYEMRTLDWCCTSINNGLTPAKEEYSVEPNETDALILKVANVTNRGLDYSEEKLSYVPESIFIRSERKARAFVGDILVLCAAHQRKYIGTKTDIVEFLPLGFEQRTIVVAELLILRPNLKRVDPFYLLSCLRLPMVQILVNKQVRGQTGHLYPSDLKKVQIPVPEDQTTQRLIAQTLYSTAREIGQLRSQIVHVETTGVGKIEDEIMFGVKHDNREVNLPEIKTTEAIAEEPNQLKMFEVVDE